MRMRLMRGCLLLVGGVLSGCIPVTVPGGDPAPSSSGSPPASSGDGADPMPSPSPNAPTPPTGTTPPPATAMAVRIAAGATAAYTDPSGQVWAADTGFSGGVTDSSATPVAIAGTDSPALYNSERYGATGANNTPAGFSYTVSVPDGAYTVRLGFAELFVTGAGQRLFDVSINGGAVLTAFDIFAAAGAMNTAITRSFPVTVANGQVVITFAPGAVQNPKVNTVEILPASGF